MLTLEQVEKLRVALAAEKVRLLRNAQEGLAFSMDRDRDKVGRDSIDEAVEEEMLSTELRLRDRESGLLAKISSALNRLDKKTIDECEDCGEEIGFKRLMARPVTTMCIGCKEEREHGERNEAPATSGRESFSSGESDEPASLPED